MSNRLVECMTEEASEVMSQRGREVERESKCIID